MPGVVVIDGRSGSGKSTLAERLARASGAQILHLDELYPGWDGLAEGSRTVARALESGGYRRYDWGRGAFAERIALDPARPLVIEGCGALTRENLAAARRWARSGAAGGANGADGAGAAWGRDASADRPARIRSIWMECSDELRRLRALDRDGEMFLPHWDRWAAQEELHLRANHPLALAAEIVHAD